MNKKGYAKEVGDVVIIFLVGFFIFMYITIILPLPIKQQEAQAKENLDIFRQKDAALTNLRFQVEAGREIKPEDIGYLVVTSKVLGGKTIIYCSDYQSEPDCTRDNVGLHTSNPSRECTWDGRCSTRITGSTVPGRMR